jgi:oligopeptidase B
MVSAAQNQQDDEKNLKQKTKRQIPVGVGLVAGVGIIAGTLSVAKTVLDTWRLNRLMNGNLRLFKGSQMHLNTIKRLFANKNERYILRQWPAVGSKDGLKRSLIALASGRKDSVTSDGEIEALRKELLTPPVANEIPFQLSDGGRPGRVDPFYYFRDDDRKDPRVLEYLKEENEYTKGIMADTEELQEALYAELRGRIQESDVSAGLALGGYKYYTRTEEGEQYAVHCRKKILSGGGDGEEEVLLDENSESKGHEFYMVGGFDVSPNHKILAFGLDTTGNEKFTLHIRDLETKKELSKPILETDGSFAWSTDNKTIFYTRKDHLDRPYQVWRHVIGTNPEKDDVMVYHEKDDAFYLGIGLSRSEKYIFISAGSAITSDVRYIKASEPESEFVSILPRVSDVEYSVEDRGDQFFIARRDQEKFNSEILIADVSAPNEYSVLIPHNPKIKIESLEASSEHLAVFQRSEGLQQAIVYDLRGQEPVDPESFDQAAGKAIEFDEPTFELHSGAQGDFDSPWLRYVYTSFTTPATVVDYNMKTGERKIQKVMPVLGGFDSSKYVSERIFATAPDGVKVPISLVYRKDLVKLDGSDPMLLDCYGSYEICNDADFRSSRLSLLDRGFLFGIAHVRGGGEMGREWYLDGKFLKKKNTFSDFLACAEYLADNKYTSPEKLCIQGRSAGGLTMGASINASMNSSRGPHFSCAIAGVPFVDVLTTMLDETIPLTTIEFEEWGNPMESEYYEYMKSYSPMDNIVEDKKYPNMLVTGGLHDPRVGYWEPAKFVANLRKKTSTRDNIILLKIDMGAGHFSKSGRFDKLRETAMEFAFLLKCQGMLATELKPSA